MTRSSATAYRPTYRKHPVRRGREVAAAIGRGAGVLVVASVAVGTTRRTTRTNPVTSAVAGPSIPNTGNTRGIPAGVAAVADAADAVGVDLVGDRPVGAPMAVTIRPPAGTAADRGTVGRVVTVVLVTAVRADMADQVVLGSGSGRAGSAVAGSVRVDLVGQVDPGSDSVVPGSVGRGSVRSGRAVAGLVAAVDGGAGPAATYGWRSWRC